MRQDAMVKAVCPMEHASTVVIQVTREDSAKSISEQSEQQDLLLLL